jgi:hypothetical protein
VGAEATAAEAGEDTPTRPAVNAVPAMTLPSRRRSDDTLNLLVKGVTDEGDRFLVEPSPR